MSLTTDIEPARPVLVSSRGWLLALVGLGLATFSVAALSGPGRIDISDGQVRYEAARGLYELGDPVIRDSRIWFWIFPGREGRLYTRYRFPQSVLGVGAIAVSDLLGPVDESRRHFIFSGLSALAAAVLVASFAVYFRCEKFPARTALAWAFGGLIATPCWFYATSTFDDLLGTAGLLAAVAVARATRDRRSTLGALVSGLLLGWVFNCKPPVAVFGLVVLAVQSQDCAAWSSWVRRGMLMAGGLLLGVAGWWLYERYKFPLGVTPDHGPIDARCAQMWPGNLWAGLVCLTVSTGAGFLWYCPAVILALRGLRVAPARVRWSLIATCSIFGIFIASILFFKGDPSWGPRYLTPVYALLWCVVPFGFAQSSWRLVAPLLASSVALQVGALAIDQHRMLVEYKLPAGCDIVHPWGYFNLRLTPWLQRPREIVEVLDPDRPPSREFSPAPEPTFAVPPLNEIPITGPQALTHYHILNSLRPWWISLRGLSPDKRPVDLASTALLLGSIGAFGLLLMVVGVRTRS